MKPIIQVLDAHNIDKFEELVAVFEDVFEMENLSKSNPGHLQYLLNSDHFFAVVAMHDNKVIAGLTVYILHQYYTETRIAYIYDLAVLREFQRRGVGKQLIKFTKDHCKASGMGEIFVQAEKIDDHAIDFYRITKPTTEEEVVHFTYKL